MKTTSQAKKNIFDTFWYKKTMAPVNIFNLDNSTPSSLQDLTHPKLWSHSVLWFTKENLVTRHVKLGHTCPQDHVNNIVLRGR